jgi:hypothetical protein
MTPSQKMALKNTLFSGTPEMGIMVYGSRWSL